MSRTSIVRSFSAHRSRETLPCRIQLLPEFGTQERSWSNTRGTDEQCIRTRASRPLSDSRHTLWDGWEDVHGHRFCRFSVAGRRPDANF